MPLVLELLLVSELPLDGLTDEPPVLPEEPAPEVPEVPDALELPDAPLAGDCDESMVPEALPPAEPMPDAEPDTEPLALG